MAIPGDVARYIDEVWPQVLDDIAALVAVDSVEDLGAAAPGSPFGPGPWQALDVALGIASRLGLESHDLDGYIGYADLPGASDEVLATIAHVDVVPAGPGWAGDPFKMERRDGYLMGRGVIDDKGPFVLSLWAAEYFKRRGLKLPRTLRCIVGVNEETEMADVPTYLERMGEPWFLFTPDAEFPVGCGEKGVFVTEFTSGPIAGGTPVSLEAGTVHNAIPGEARAVVRKAPEDCPEFPGITLRALEDGATQVLAQGVGGHASIPAGTVNALGVLASYLLANQLYDQAEQGAFLGFLQSLMNTSGAALGLAATDERFDPLTLVCGVAKTHDQRFTLSVDVRFPPSVTSEHIHSQLFAAAERAGLATAKPHVKEPFYLDPTSPEVEALLAAYSQVTGTPAKAFTMGGGTYARKFAHGVSFGPEEDDPNKPEWAGSMHGPNEAVSEASLKRALAIYIDAIGRLMNL